MNKKILGIIAASTAAIGSAIIASPAHAQVSLPVTVEVQPQIFLSTYKDLKFVVTQKDLSGAVPDQSVSYDENGTIKPPNKVRPILGAPVSTITREIDPLYYVWAPNATAMTVKVGAKKSELTRTLPIADLSDKVTMSVIDGASTPLTGTGLGNANAVSGKAKLEFKFVSPPDAGTYAGGEVSITVASP